MENKGQRLDTAKFPRIIGNYWREKKKEGERELKKERESGPAAIPGIPLYVELPALFDGLISPIFSSCNKPTETHYMFKSHCLD